MTPFSFYTQRAEHKTTLYYWSKTLQIACLPLPLVFNQNHVHFIGLPSPPLPTWHCHGGWRDPRGGGYGNHLQASLKVDKLPEIILVWAACFFQMFTLTKVKILTETWCKLPMPVLYSHGAIVLDIAWTGNSTCNLFHQPSKLDDDDLQTGFNLKGKNLKSHVSREPESEDLRFLYHWAFAQCFKTVHPCNP